MELNDNSHLPKSVSLPKWLIGLVDISLVNLGLYLSFVLTGSELQGYQVGPLLLLLPSISIFTVLLFNSLGLYGHQRSDFVVVFRALLTGVIGLALFSILFAFMTRAFLFQRTIFVAATLIQLLLLLGWRILYWRLEYWIQGQKRLLLIGSGEDADLALEKLKKMPRGLFSIAKILDPRDLDSLTESLEQVDAVMITGSLDLDLKSRIIRSSFNRDREVYIIPELYEIILTRATMTQLHDTPVIECREMRLSLAQLFFKRLVDLSLTLLVAIPVVIVLIPLVVAIKVTSPGPIIFAQERVGLYGRSFILYKLRSMITEAEDESGPVFATEEDDRVTAVGRFLRKTRLDELPQLFNVLRGDLSIVGPRPERPFFVEQFSEQMPDYKLRHLVKPGITGLAQVAGFYATNTHDKLRYDLYYVTDYSLFLDFRILLLTIPTLFNSEAAKGVGEKLTGRLSQDG
jgi:exopolysaccharide biosynthesis polyprenyl glycosylphosphotransferase